MIKIIWTDRAKSDYWNNIDYLETAWTIKEVERFTDKTDAILEKISKGNLKFKPTEHENIFQVPIVKQITLFYKNTPESVYLLRFWNTYQNPESLNLK
jgi:plasmid stabilization system protein ParE